MMEHKQKGEYVISQEKIIYFKTWSNKTNTN